MSVDPILAFRQALEERNILDPNQLSDVDALRSSMTDVKALAKELIHRHWLSGWQAQMILKGRVAELTLGSYLLLDHLGEGGMGKVYKARHQLMGRIVALKIIRKERLANPDTVRRFRREIQAAAQLTHPNVVLAYDADQIGDSHFFAMEFVDGIDLGKLVKDKGPLPIREACDYIRQAALGLQHAHDRGLIHRDIKPSNLLLTTSREETVRAALSGVISANAVERMKSTETILGVVKILDMGLARLQENADGNAPSKLTHEGLVIGTPDFLAPEQARNSSKVDIRADLYGLGGTLYFLLTGQVPYPGGTPTEKLLKHAIDPPPEVLALRPDTPTPLVAILKKLLAKNPDDRYQVPGELAAELDPFCLEPGTLRPSGKFRPPPKKETPPASTPDPSTASEFRVPLLTQARLEQARHLQTKPARSAAKKKALLAAAVVFVFFVLSGAVTWLVLRALGK
jgi:serine/threonine protein kinase